MHKSHLVPILVHFASEDTLHSTLLKTLCCCGIHLGDEYAQTRNGNNNWYGHDNKMTRFEWDQLDKVKDTYFRFYRLQVITSMLYQM